MLKQVGKAIEFCEMFNFLIILLFLKASISIFIDLSLSPFFSRFIDLILHYGLLSVFTNSITPEIPIELKEKSTSLMLFIFFII